MNPWSAPDRALAKLDESWARLVMRGYAAEERDVLMCLGQPPGAWRNSLAHPSFYPLLLPEEVRCLRRVFDGLDLPPRPGDASRAARVRWNIAARAYLLRLAGFLRAVQRGSFEPRESVERGDPTGIAAITRNGSLLSIGAPEPSGERVIRYLPLRLEPDEPRVFRARLAADLVEDRPIKLGRLTVSPLAFLATAPAGSDDPLRLRDGWASPPVSLLPRLQDARVLREAEANYLALRELLASVPAQAPRRHEAEAELLAAALLFQRLQQKDALGRRLEEVVAFKCRSVAYRLEGRVVVRAAGGREQHLGPVEGGLQRLVVGAPVVLLRPAGQGGGDMVVHATSIIEQIW